MPDAGGTAGDPDGFGCGHHSAEDTITNTRFVRKIPFCGMGSLVLISGRLCPEDSAPGNPHFNSGEPAGVFQGAPWGSVQVLVSLWVVSVGDAKLMTTKESVYGGEASQRI